MIWVVFVLLAVLGVGMQLAALTSDLFAESRCTCSKGAVNRDCPVHGRGE